MSVTNDLLKSLIAEVKASKSGGSTADFSEVLAELRAIREELTLLRESQRPPTFPLVGQWATWIKNRAIGQIKASQLAAEKQQAGRLAQAQGGNPIPAKVVQAPDPNADVDREAPAFLEVVQ